MPSPVDRYFQEVKDQNPSYSDSQAWATAWSIYCKHKNPGSDHCQKDPSEYLTGKSAGVIVRVASRAVEAVGPTLAQRVAARFLEAADGLSVGSWYEQKFKSTDSVLYFHALAKQKNGGWSGVLVETDPSNPRKNPKAKRFSIPKSFTAPWQPTKDLPDGVESAARAYDKTATIALKVAERFMTGHLGLLKADEVQEVLQRGGKVLAEAQALAKKAESELSKYEREARAIHHDAVDGLRKVKDVAEKVPHKDTPAIVATIEKCIRQIQTQNWTSALTVESGLVQFVIYGFRDMQKAYTRIRTKPEVLEVQRVLKDDLQPARAELQKLQDRFDKEFRKYIDDLEDLLKDLTIIAFHHQQIPEMSDFNHLKDMVAINVRGLMTRSAEMPETLASIVDNLSEAGDLFDKIKAHAKTTQLGE